MSIIFVILILDAIILVLFVQYQCLLAIDTYGGLVSIIRHIMVDTGQNAVQNKKIKMHETNVHQLLFNEHVKLMYINCSLK